MAYLDKEEVIAAFETQYQQVDIDAIDFMIKSTKAHLTVQPL